MINILPSELKQNITYARRNTSLRAWMVAILVAIGCVVIVIAAGHVYLQHSINNYSQQVALSKQQLADQKLEETGRDIEAISGNLKLVTQVLSRAMLFSRLLGQIGATIPNGSVLTSLNISNRVQGGIDLSFSATDYHTATQVQVNLADPENKIFEKADIVSVQCDEPGASETTTMYPCRVQIRALFAKNNSFSLINPSSGATP